MPLKGLLLAGGYGTRLRPLTFTGNKHMIPIANQPMLFFGLHHLREAGVEEAAIILGPITEGIREAVGDGSAFGLRVTYIVQGEPKGLAHAVRVARSFLGEDPFLMYLGDNLLEHGPAPYLAAFRTGHPSAVVGAVPVAHPERYGVVEIDAEGRILSLAEKPPEPRSNLALIGVYLFTPAIHAVIEGLRPSARGELEITDAIRELERRTGRVRVLRLAGWWKDTGQVGDLLEANERVLASRPPEFFENSAEVRPGARLTGPIRAGPGTVLGPDVTVHGPCVLGAGVRIEAGASIGPFVSLGDRAVVRRATVTRSILLEEARIDLPDAITQSIVGRRSTLDAGPGDGTPHRFVLGDASRVEL